ncbi:MAG: hypothetical protein ACREMY_02385 [bacterium]
MNGRRTLVGLALLSAFALSAFAVPSMAQAGTGTTAFTCVSGGGAKDFSDSHCKTSVTPGTGAYGHETITVGTKTAIASTSTLTNITLSGTIATIKVKVTCTGATGTGFLTNEEPSAGNHTLTGSETEITYTGCDIDLGKAEVTCSLAGGKIELPGVKAIDVESAHGFAMGIKFEPEKGTTFATFTTGADCPNIPNQTFNITGSAVGVPNGATLEFTEATTKPTLSLGGNAASFTDTDTLTMSGGGNGISVTTTP